MMATCVSVQGGKPEPTVRSFALRGEAPSLAAEPRPEDANTVPIGPGPARGRASAHQGLNSAVLARVGLQVDPS